MRFYVYVAHSVTTRKNLMREHLTDGNNWKKIMNLDDSSSRTFYNDVLSGKDNK